MPPLPILRFLLILMASGSLRAADRFTPEAIWPDDQGTHINAHGGGVMFHGGTYYWFGEHKVAGPRGNSAEVGVACYSSKTLYDWKHEGIALPVDDNPRSEIARSCIIERPKVFTTRAPSSS